MDQILVLTNVPDQTVAATLAEHLVEHGLAACVNILAPCTSIYRWRGKTARTQEIPLLIKTTRIRYLEVEASICKLHPYELPEIIHVPVEGGLPAYLTWVSEETSR
ncbi:divalent-cation tolerance protein CutA [mine drainage metagenome]|uniref:Divalent-cation tolerance protein CutA n=1 Tax=mine drainage metagenome TaxID=410659 RepID=A0A1J5QWD4_9ZZZZ